MDGWDPLPQAVSPESGAGVRRRTSSMLRGDVPAFGSRCPARTWPLGEQEMAARTVESRDERLWTPK